MAVNFLLFPSHHEVLHVPKVATPNAESISTAYIEALFNCMLALILHFDKLAESLRC
ncbi:uncharacterized protein PHALS_00708 [Plasmopara halstedii]|uniref:Uncharacterized protein n=1 Tax=Plasmopara halstedii TaxID=4781 RepID=A0A0N7L6I1_PLAHL|nr:uncharacterized protein PHALS_00708 [Plasmopara halstedii]CEG44339.1 hypothetical protein PHALS_00708 [Plasmopara halstedii]|eukprot:XP_024580708.1 hypothetical protein PHALS_00708 [Plasmopara halstedii]